MADLPDPVSGGPACGSPAPGGRERFGRPGERLPVSQRVAVADEQ
jgi:hypothetical protein